MISAESIVAFTPPVEQHNIPGYAPNIFLVREDLGPLIGGNKIRRLVSWCQNKKKFNAIHLLSDYGSNSHFALAKIFEFKIFSQLEKIVLYERKVVKNPFRKMLRAQYTNKDGIQIKSMNSLLSWLKYFAFQKEGHLFLPIGGSVKCQNIYDSILNLKILKSLGEQTIFSVPVGSGNSFFEIYKTIRNKNIPGKFVCPITATSPKIYRAALKRYQNTNVNFFHIQEKTWEEYLLKSNWFKRYTDVLLDPIHGIFLLDVLEKFKKNKINLVLWITSPKWD